MHLLLVPSLYLLAQPLEVLVRRKRVLFCEFLILTVTVNSLQLNHRWSSFWYSLKRLFCLPDRTSGISLHDQIVTVGVFVSCRSPGLPSFTDNSIIETKNPINKRRPMITSANIVSFTAI